MNRLRGKKKVKEEVAPPRPSVDSDQSGPFRMFTRSKKVMEEPKPEIDLTSALPPSDDFRTSLLMTGLSARFSMLREQDDPSSKLGKASDDSVLFPKRQSRLDFGLSTGLQDIAEVGSIRSNNLSHMDSFQFSDDSPSTPGSIMNRGKPVDGNNLFGGRQKIYKITASGSTRSVGLNGRPLHDDDVSMSAFQKWRQTRGPGEYESIDFTEPMPDFPSHIDTHNDTHNDFSRRRETSSTTSSAPSGGRNSTAATSVVSTQPAPSLKDWQPSGAAAPSSGNSTPVERSVTRTRRLYEQGLTQDLQDQQSSALSRIDTLSRQRHFSTRTPEFSSGTTSPTAGNAPGDRTERRTVLTKASAPNLRSFSPPNSGGLHPEPMPKLPSRMDQRSVFTTSPPLSPPISEAGEAQPFNLPKAEEGKVNGVPGLFNRTPGQQYDESKFAQRQRQLQQANEAQAARARTDSVASVPRSRSRSSSSARQMATEKIEIGMIQQEPTVQEEVLTPTFLDMGDDDEPPMPTMGRQPSHTAPQVTVDRPADGDHPALRRGSPPATLDLSKKADCAGGLSPTSGNPEHNSPEDSPTLGPNSGLSGMVRQHLRNVSTTSSGYGEDFEDGLSEPSPSAKVPFQPLSSNPTPVSKATTGPNTPPVSHPPASQPPPVPAIPQSVPRGRQSSFSRPSVSPPRRTSSTSTPVAAPQSLSEEPMPRRGRESPEGDEFARHLADGARRVRERLTSYVDSDHSRSTSPMPTPNGGQEYHPPRGSSLRRPSRGASMERERAPREQSQTRAKKILGLGLSNQSTSPAVPNVPFESTEFPRMDTATPEPVQKTSQERNVSEPEAPQPDEPVHAGLKAFRQARRELQRMKEKEVQQRSQGHMPDAPSKPPPPPPAQQRPPQWQERSGPPVSYSRGPSEEGGNRSRSRAGSIGPYGRDRSDSEASNYGPARPRKASSPFDNYNRPYSPSMNGGPSPGYGPRPSGTPDYRRQMGMQSTGSSRESSPGRSPYPRPNTANGSYMPMRGAMPSPGPMAAAPPLPPINPRRREFGSGSFRHVDERPGSPRTVVPHGVEKSFSGRAPLRMSDDEGSPGQFRQRLRKVTSEGNGLRGRPNRSSPPRDVRPPMPAAAIPAENMNGGMI